MKNSLWLMTNYQAKLKRLECCNSILTALIQDFQSLEYGLDLNKLFRRANVLLFVDWKSYDLFYLFNKRFCFVGVSCGCLLLIDHVDIRLTFHNWNIFCASPFLF